MPLYRLSFGAALSICLAVVALAVSAAPETPAPTAIELKTVNYRDLGAAIRAKQGQVVMVDVWATWCPPCVKNFPHIVELNKKYAKDGLACISVSLDKPENNAKALDFLKSKEATFSNYLLAEEAKVWQEKWDVNGPPIYFVFDRQGRRAAKFDASDPDHPINFEEIEKLVKKLLDEGK